MTFQSFRIGTVRPQFREICDLRDQRPGLVRRSTKQTRPGRSSERLATEHRSAGRPAARTALRVGGTDRRHADRSQAARHWDLVRTNFDLDAPLTEHWGFLESVVTEFEKVDAKTYTEHLHEQSPLSSSSSEEEVPDALEAQLLLKLAQAEKIRPRKVSVSRRCVQNERRRRRSQQMASSGEEPASGAEHGEECQKEGYAGGQSFPTQRASSCPPPRVEPPGPPAADRRRRGSLLSRLLGLPTGQSRRPSLPAPVVKPPPAAAPPPSEEDHEVHHPTWFERTAGPEAAAGPTADRRALSRRRATVAEVSLKEFLHEVDERAQHLRDEEFCGADPYEVLAPEQKAADDDHVVPLLNTSRCVKLMLEDAERRLEREYAPNMALVGYQQMALALARHSTVGYRELVIALARREPSPSQCQGVQTSPQSASPADCRPGPSTGQSRSAQTSPGSPPCTSPPSGGAVWTVAVWEPPVLAAPPARLLAYGQPSWVARQQSSEEAAELRRRLDSGQRAAGRRRDSLLRRRAERAAQMAGQSGRHGGDHERADGPRRPFWR
ncbi:hypothetical protein FJT64_012215 [Amphibalanus amphitrite]|uniref:Uncharacterized protein n=1 Tax=Amphibalanus amphitrite TaxID=1232801 RepID=A0A6A4V8W5_AMPAM|nr:hypothetical protein FJT64_012215 [Amphibalanus amphitrite]